MTFATSFQAIILIEGGFGDDPDDAGGATRFGITERVARANGYSGAMWDLPLSTAKRIYKSQYWDPLRLHDIDRIAPAIAAELFGTGVNMGIARAGLFLQRSLNVLNNRGSLWSDIVVDGLVGPVTIGAFRAFIAWRGDEGITVLLRALNGLQVARYFAISEANETNEKFIYGWLRERVT